MLAMAQARIVAEAIRARRANAKVELVPIVTRGDRARGSVGPSGGKGLFTAELESALRAGDVQLAVHSAKDLPAALPDDLVIAAIPSREDPRDALVSRGGGGIESLPRGATVATSSQRRRAQLLAVRPDLQVVPIRGNVETRIRKALDSPGAGPDAVVLAMAGLRRSGLAVSHAKHICPLAVEAMIPPAGQGALAVQCLALAAEAIDIVAPLDEPVAHQAVLAERAVLRAMGADCRSCIAVHIAPDCYRGEQCWRALAMLAHSDGGNMARFDLTAATPAEAATALLDQMRENRRKDRARR